MVRLERWREVRAVAIDDASDAGLIERVLGEYREMPELALTVEQAQRLWGCDAVTCRRIADLLVERRDPSLVARAPPHAGEVAMRGSDEHLA